MTAKVDYAVRAMVFLARAGDDRPVKGDAVAEAEDLPLKYLENILAQLRAAGLVRSQRGADGGYWLAVPAEEITVAEIIRVVEGPLAHVRGERPERLEAVDGSATLRDLWVAVRASLRNVLDHVTLADLVAGELPAQVAGLLDDPTAWE